MHAFNGHSFDSLSCSPEVLYVWAKPNRQLEVEERPRMRC